MRDNKKIVIKCPQCGCEYLPAEIYIPKYFVGHPECIEKDISGKVLNCYGTMFNPIEHYICDKCNTKFKIKADVKFNTYIEEEFKKDYKIKLKPTSLFLKED